MKLDKICRTCLMEKANMKSLFGACLPGMIMSCAAVQIVQGDGLPPQICTQCVTSASKSYQFKQLCEKSDATLRNYISMKQLQPPINLPTAAELRPDLTHQNMVGDHHNRAILSSCQQALVPNHENLISCQQQSNTLLTNHQTLISNNQSNMVTSHQGGFLTEHHSNLAPKHHNTINQPNMISSGLPHQNLVLNDMHEVRTDFFGTTLINGSSDVLHQNTLFQDIFSDPAHPLVDNFTHQAHTVVSDLAETMQSLQTIAEQCLPDSWETDNQICPINPEINADIAAEETTNNFNLVENLYKCQFCEDMFKDEWSLAEHSKNHSCQEKYFSTNITSELTKSMLLEYTFDTNSKDTFMFENTEPTSQNLLCNICDRTFTDQKYLKKHLRDIHFIDTSCIQEERKHTCSICGKRYKKHKVLVIHMRTHTGERPFKCEICSRTFVIASSLYKHRKIHKKVKYHCTICGRIFNQSSNVSGHMLTHTAEKRHTCNTCGKSFRTNSNLEVHKRVHTGIKPYICSFCDKPFNTSTQLKKHMMVHTGEKPYTCYTCGRSFRRKETRDTHVRYHTGERPYSCKVCNKKYIAASHLRDHMKSHTNQRNYDCMICKKKFLGMKSLKSHILSHTGQRPYCCQLCGKRFVQNGNLLTHLKNVHNQ